MDVCSKDNQGRNHNEEKYQLENVSLSRTLLADKLRGSCSASCIVCPRWLLRGVRVMDIGISR